MTAWKHINDEAVYYDDNVLSKIQIKMTML